MKQLDLIRKLTSEHSVVFVRHGGDHDWYRNVVTGHREAIPRHREIDERLARKIIKKLSNPADGV